MLLWNSPGHLLHKTNHNLSYFKLSYVFLEHKDKAGKGTTVQYVLYRMKFSKGIHSKENDPTL